MKDHILNNEKTFNIWIVYYLLLGIIQALWTNTSSFPPEPLRIAMMAAVFGPVVLRREIILLAIPFAMTLRGYLSTNYSFLPDTWSYEYYLGVIVLSMVVHMKQLNFSLYGKMKPLIVMLLYFAIVDVISKGEVGNYAINIFIGLLLVPFLKKDEDFHLLSAALIAVSVLLAVHYLIMFDRFLEDWGSGGLERSGWADANYFATMLDRGLFVAIMYLFGFCKSKYLFFNKKLLGACCLFIAAAVCMTASRAGFLCMAFIVVAVALTSKLSFKHFLLSIIFIAAAGVYMYSKGMMELLLYRFIEEDGMLTGNGRIAIWQRMLRNFGNQDVANIFVGGGYWHRAELTLGLDLHNEFLSIMADYGLIGLSLFVSFFFSISSFRRGEFWKQNVAVIFYFLSIISLSPFQTIFILFLIVWIYANKFSNAGLLIRENDE